MEVCTTLAGTRYSLERMSLSSLLHSSQHILVDTECDSDGKGSQGQVSDDGQNGEESKGQQQYQHATKHNGCLLDVTPVDQVQHWKEKAIYNITREVIETFTETLKTEYTQIFHLFW